MVAQQLFVVFQDFGDEQRLSIGEPDERVAPLCFRPDDLICIKKETSIGMDTASLKFLCSA